MKSLNLIKKIIADKRIINFSLHFVKNKLVIGGDNTLLNSQTLCFEWLRSKKEDVKPSTYDKYEMIINNYLISFFGHNSLDQLNINIIKEYLMKLLNKGLSSSVVKTIKKCLKKQSIQPMKINMASTILIFHYSK